MWMAELSARTGLSVPTIKFYLREGLLPPGEAVGATRSRYSEEHVRRLKLVRALTDVAHLRIDTVRAVLEDINSARTWHEAIGSAHRRLSPTSDEPVSDDTLRTVDELLERTGWTLRGGKESPHRLALAQAIQAIAGLGHPLEPQLLDAYAEAMANVAENEVENLQDDDRESAAELAVIGTVLLEPVLLTIRRIAQENAARERGTRQLAARQPAARAGESSVRKAR